MIHWREFEPADEAALRRIHARQCAAFGLATGFPPLSGDRFLFRWVAEAAGAPVAALAAWPTAELYWIADQARPLRDLLHRAPALAGALAQTPVTEYHVCVHHRALRQLTPLLRRAGFARSHPDYLPFVRNLAGA